MILLHQDLERDITPPDERIWENPDPRIQWALDILEPPGGEIQSLVSRGLLPSTGAFLGFFGVIGYNFQKKLPIKSNLAAYVGLTCLGAFVGEKSHAYYREKKADQIAAAKHYIMLHPERFPEPEKMKLGDKRVFHRWNPQRWGPTGVDYRDYKKF